MFTTEDEHTIRCEKEAMNIGLSCWNKFIMELRGQFVDYVRGLIALNYNTILCGKILAQVRMGRYL